MPHRKDRSEHLRPDHHCSIHLDKSSTLCFRLNHKSFNFHGIHPNINPSTGYQSIHQNKHSNPVSQLWHWSRHMTNNHFPTVHFRYYMCHDTAGSCRLHPPNPIKKLNNRKCHCLNNVMYLSSLYIDCYTGRFRSHIYSSKL